jgi:hypothetical protein
LQTATLPLPGFFPLWLVVHYNDRTHPYTIGHIELYTGSDCLDEQLIAVQSAEYMPSTHVEALRVELLTVEANNRRRAQNLAQLSAITLQRSPDFRDGRREYRLQPHEVAQQDGFADEVLS